MNKTLYKTFKKIGKKKTFNSWERDVVASIKNMDDYELSNEIEHYKIALEKEKLLKPLTVLEMVSGFINPIVVCLVTIMAMRILQESISSGIQHKFVNGVGYMLVIVIIVIGIIIIASDYFYNHRRANKLSFYQRMITIMEAQYKKRMVSRNRKKRRK